MPTAPGPWTPRAFRNHNITVRAMANQPSELDILLSNLQEQGGVTHYLIFNFEGECPHLRLIWRARRPTRC